MEEEKKKENWKKDFTDRWYSRLAFPEVDMPKVLEWIEKGVEEMGGEVKDWEKEFDEKILKPFPKGKYKGWGICPSQIIAIKSFIRRLLTQTAKGAKIEILNELLDRFTEGNFIGISSVHRLLDEISLKK